MLQGGLREFTAGCGKRNDSIPGSCLIAKLHEFPLCSMSSCHIMSTFLLFAFILFVGGVQCYWLNVQQPDTSWEVTPSVDGIRYLARRHSDNL